MITLTRLNETKLTINPFLIETIEETPQTVIVLLSGKKFIVKESTNDIRNSFIDFLSESVKSGIEKSREK
ncbi:MAG: flagellar FlbD family protein [Brevinematales bacterium]|nr:flagellar FlbD family protein [Brevinematales bacterium]